MARTNAWPARARRDPGFSERRANDDGSFGYIDARHGRSRARIGGDDGYSTIGRDQADLHNFNRLIEYSGVRLIGIADGIDTASASSALTFGMKSVIDSIYRKQLGDKTLRGLQGRALAGYATGGVAYGYALRKQVDAFGKSIGSRIEVVEERAKVVRRIFDLHLEGKSIAGIARVLNDEKIPPPRVYAKRRRAGWKDSTIRNILHNETYAGILRYGLRKWRKFPGTNKRRYTAADPTKVVTKQRDDLRIVSAYVWSDVQSRLNAISAHYTRTKDGKPKGRSIPGRPSRYLFSSLLHCGVCASGIGQKRPTMIV